jgi:hypothetical protein
MVELLAPSRIAAVITRCSNYNLYALPRTLCRVCDMACHIRGVRGDTWRVGTMTAHLPSANGAKASRDLESMFTLPLWYLKAVVYSTPASVRREEMEVSEKKRRYPESLSPDGCNGQFVTSARSKWCRNNRRLANGCEPYIRLRFAPSGVNHATPTCWTRELIVVCLPFAARAGRGWLAAQSIMSVRGVRTPAKARPEDTLHRCCPLYLIASPNSSNSSSIHFAQSAQSTQSTQSTHSRLDLSRCR